MPSALDQLAVVIPVGPGDRSWPGLLSQLGQLAPQLQTCLVFAHGDLQRRPREPEQVWIESARGRARQQNAGAARFDQRWLWFLHADSRIDPSCILALTGLLARGEDMLGYFGLRFHDGGVAMRLTEWGTMLRCSLFALPFGDQGLVLPRACFYRLGCFDEDLPRGEDLALAVEARRAGLAVHRLHATIATSARRYRQEGWLACTLRHQWWTWSQRWRMR